MPANVASNSGMSRRNTLRLSCSRSRWHVQYPGSCYLRSNRAERAKRAANAQVGHRQALSNEKARPWAGLSLWDMRGASVEVPAERNVARCTVDEHRLERAVALRVHVPRAIAEDAEVRLAVAVPVEQRGNVL